MELTIANRNVPIKTGVRFLEELDKRYKTTIEGQEVDFGLNQLYVNFALGSIPALKLAVYAGTRTNQAFKPTPEQIDDFLESHEDLDWLFDAFAEQLRESNMTKKGWNALESNLPDSE